MQLPGFLPQSYHTNFIFLTLAHIDYSKSNNCVDQMIPDQMTLIKNIPNQMTRMSFLFSESKTQV